MAKKATGYTITCDACPFTATAAAEEAAQVIALQHVGSAHKDANPAHMLGQHMHIVSSEAAEATE